jgi:hypothetical protein
MPVNTAADRFTLNFMFNAIATNTYGVRVNMGRTGTTGTI